MYVCKTLLVGSSRDILMKKWVVQPSYDMKCTRVVNPKNLRGPHAIKTEIFEKSVKIFFLAVSVQNHEDIGYNQAVICGA